MRRHAKTLSCLALPLVLLSVSSCSGTNSQASESPQAGPIEFAGQWGVKGTEPGQLEDPAGITTDTLGNVYITDAGSLFVQKFDGRGTPLLAFQEPPLKHPQSIAVDDFGVIYVSDPARGSVFVFMPDDQHHREIRMRARPNAENELSVAVDDDGTIDVFDRRAGRVWTFSQRLRFLRSWFPEGPKGGTGHLGPLEMGGDHNIWIANSAENCFLRFSGTGQLLAKVTAGTAEADPKISDQFAVSHDYIFAMDTNGLMLHVLALDGRPKVDVDLAPQLGQANRLPPAIAVSTKQELFVLDAPECRVYRYRIHL